MRLTKIIREEMKQAIMRDVPDDRKETFNLLKKHATHWFRTNLPEGIRQALDDGFEDFIHHRMIHVVIVPDGKTRWNDYPDKFNEGFDVPHHAYCPESLIKDEPWYIDAIDSIQKSTDARYKAREEIQNALKSVTTAKRLKDVYPDLAKYLPTDISGQALAVPQSLPNLHATGWPDETRKQDAESAEASDTE